MLLQLDRYGSLPGIGTFGELTVGDILFKTVEREWLDNKGFVSCVPNGLYSLSPHHSQKKGDCFILENHQLNVYKFDTTHRYAILIHIANFPNEVQGCIGIGKQLTYINGELGVTHSAASLQELQQILKDDEHQLQINWIHL